MTKAIEVSWLKGDAAGYTDVFPVDEFAVEIRNVERVHRLRGPKGGTYFARYRLVVQGVTATLDYSAFADVNERNGIELGVMAFRFTSIARNEVAQLMWNGRPIPTSEATAVTTTSANTLAEVITSQERALARQLTRRGRAQFRHNLDVAYGARCCVSGCGVPWAIDAAHIQPYKDRQSNNVTNGLLLRSDLHALFDAGRMAIHPKTRAVYFAEDARAWPEYGSLHGSRLRTPQPGYEGCAPKKTSLVARWRAFVREHGNPESEGTHMSVDTPRRAV